MESMTKILIGAVCVVVTSAGLGEAADLYEPSIVEHDPERAVEFGSGWYLRGDLGATLWNRPRISFDAPQFVTPSTVSGIDLENTISVSGGFGYRFDRYFRADVTLDYHTETDYEARLAGDCLTGTSNCTSVETAILADYVLLANAYADLGNFKGFSPYVGAGIGAAWMEWSRYNSRVTCNSNCDSFTAPYVADIPHRTSDHWRFAYALMAGLGYDFTENLTLDLGYRFLSIADGQMTQEVTQNGQQGAVNYDDLYAHEIRVGLRYKID